MKRPKHRSTWCNCPSCIRMEFEGYSLTDQEKQLTRQALTFKSQFSLDAIEESKAEERRSVERRIAL